MHISKLFQVLNRYTAIIYKTKPVQIMCLLRYARESKYIPNQDFCHVMFSTVVMIEAIFKQVLRIASHLSALHLLYINVCFIFSFLFLFGVCLFFFFSFFCKYETVNTFNGCILNSQ